MRITRRSKKNRKSTITSFIRGFSSSNYMDSSGNLFTDPQYADINIRNPYVDPACAEHDCNAYFDQYNAGNINGDIALLVGTSDTQSSDWVWYKPDGIYLKNAAGGSSNVKVAGSTSVLTAYYSRAGAICVSPRSIGVQLSNNNPIYTTLAATIVGEGYGAAHPIPTTTTRASPFVPFTGTTSFYYEQGHYIDFTAWRYNPSSPTYNSGWIGTMESPYPQLHTSNSRKPLTGFNTPRITFNNNTGTITLSDPFNDGGWSGISLPYVMQGPTGLVNGAPEGPGLSGWYHVKAEGTLTQYGDLGIETDVTFTITTPVETVTFTKFKIDSSSPYATSGYIEGDVYGQRSFKFRTSSAPYDQQMFITGLCGGPLTDEHKYFARLHQHYEPPASCGGS